VKVFTILFSLCALNFAANAADDADLVLINANIYTANEKQPRAEAIAVKGGRVLFVGSNAEARKFSSQQVIDLHSRTVVPGLTDSHCHIFGIGERELTLNLEGTNTLQEFLAKISERATKREPGKWITGRGWIETFWKPAQFPNPRSRGSCSVTGAPACSASAFWSTTNRHTSRRGGARHDRAQPTPANRHPGTRRH